MARKPVADVSAWPSITLEGALVAPAMIASIDRRQATEQSETDYGIRKGLTIREEISTAFRVGQSHVDAFAKLSNPSLEATRRFARDFLVETFGFHDLAPVQRAVAFLAGGRVPIVVAPPSDEKLDRRSAVLSTDRSCSPASALQDELNDHDHTLWGLVTNGAVIRLMRENPSLTRPAYIEADLADIFANEDAASFALLWLLIHRSRFGVANAPATDCALERWRDAGAREGEAARNRLAVQVEAALKALGSGFLEANSDLAAKLRSGEVNLTGWFNELLRLVYRLIFLMAAEDRNLLHPEKASAQARWLYAEGYSLTNLRAQCVRASTWDRRHDRFEGVKIVFRALAHGEEALALPPLGGLFTADKLPHLETARLPNRAFMAALYRLSWLDGKTGKVPVNWRAMETEELGSVYESLLELQPQLGDDGRTLNFASEVAEQKGNQRKTTGSYYTPDSLVQALLDTALDPVLDRTEAEAGDPAAALLKLSVIDPACGSGHFLLSAARRIASRLARIRAHGTPADADFRHAMRDVARSCIYGVDRNPMAVELTKVALWIETVDPGLPLGFFDAQVRSGDSLLGVFDLKVLEQGIPDAAFKPQTGDDKDVAKYYAQKNKREKAEREKVAGGFRFDRRADLMREFAELHAMPETTLADVEAKAARLKALTAQGAASWTLARACDLYVAAFLLPKRSGGQFAGPDGLPRRGAETVPTSGTVWEWMRGAKPFGPLLGAAVDAASAGRAFHWPLEFPDVMQGGGFDVVCGNPPYLSALEQANAEELGARLFVQEHFESAKGAFDIYIPFIERGSKLASSGISCLLTPNKFLSAPYGEALRDYFVREEILHAIDDFSRGSHFADASVYPIITTLRRDGRANGQIFVRRHIDASTEDFCVSAHLVNSLPSHNLGILLSEQVDKLFSIIDKCITFSSIAEINASTTAAEADEYANCLREEDDIKGRYWKVVNTGTIDPFFSLWGSRPMRHAKKEYTRPVFLKHDKLISERRKLQYSQPKIVFAKIGITTEAVFDQIGEYAGLKAGDEGKFLTAYVNSEIGSWVYRQLFGALAMSGGYLQYQSPQIRDWPVPKYNSRNTHHAAVVQAYNKVTLGQCEKTMLDQLVEEAVFCEARSCATSSTPPT
jgi:hypothetical protein